MEPQPNPTLTSRDRAILRAVDGGNAELVAAGSEPDLYLDGRHCSDQFAARRLAIAGLIAAGPGTAGGRVRARLTAAGRAQLVGAPEARLAG